MLADHSITEFIAHIDSGTASPHAGWYDWFCKDSALAKKTAKLMPKVRILAKSPKVNPDTMYVFLKNNYPLYGDHKLYDNIRIADRETGDVVYNVCPKDPFGKASVYGKTNDFKEPLVSGTWDDVILFFFS